MIELAQATLAKNGLPAEKEFSSSTEEFIPQSLDAVKGRKYAVKKLARVKGALTETEMKKLLNNGKPFQAVIAIDARHLQEDWVRPDPTQGSIPHVFNVVGYGEGVDPNDNRKKSYFIIRDSFTPGQYHYRIAADVFLPLNFEALRVTEVG